MLLRYFKRTLRRNPNSRFISFCDDLTWVPFLKIETWQRTWEKYIFKPNSSWFCAKMTQLFAHFFGNFTTFVTLLLQIPKSFQITLRAQKSESWAWVRQPRRSKLGFWKAQLGPSWLPHSVSALGPSFRPQAARPSCGPCCSSHLHRKVCQPRRNAADEGEE